MRTKKQNQKMLFGSPDGSLQYLTRSLQLRSPASASALCSEPFALSSSKIEHSTAQHSTAEQSSCLLLLLLFVSFSTSGVEHSTAKQCTAQQSTGSAQSSTAQSSTAQQSKAERQLSASASALCFLISSFCILLFCVSASVFCCCLKSFFDAYQNRNLIFPRTPARSLKGEPRGTLTIFWALCKKPRDHNIER